MPTATEVFATEKKRSAADKLGVGSPMRTAALRDEFNLYKADGGELQWREWLESRGYGADGPGNAYLKGEDE